MAAAGVKRSMQRCLRNVDFFYVIASASLKTVTQNTLVSREHRMFMQESTKIALSYLDMKRIVLPNGVNTVPYGYNGVYFS